MKARDDSSRDTRRRFEQWARNSQCAANTISAVHNIPMSDVAKAEGGKATMGQSPFALARGQQFERLLYSKGGEPLYEQLRKHGVVPENAQGLADLRLRINGGRLKGLDEALAATSELFTRLAGRKSKADDPWLVSSATVRIPGGVMLPEAMLVGEWQRGRALRNRAVHGRPLNEHEVRSLVLTVRKIDDLETLKRGLR